jgi:hypothetical protein
MAIEREDRRCEVGTPFSQLAVNRERSVTIDGPSTDFALARGMSDVTIKVDHSAERDSAHTSHVPRRTANPKGQQGTREPARDLVFRYALSDTAASVTTDYRWITPDIV